MLFLKEEDDFAGKEQKIGLDQVNHLLTPAFVCVPSKQQLATFLLLPTLQLVEMTKDM